MMKKIFLLLYISVCCYVAQAQKVTLSVTALENTKVKIEWQNPYGDSLVQVNVQRSWDSVKLFKTIFVPLSTELPQNGYIDATAGYTGMYYRIFYVLSDGRFFFTKAKKAALGSDFTNEIREDQAANKDFLITIHDEDSVIAQLNYDGYKKFRDSIVNFTRDTLYSLTDADVLIRYYNNTVSWLPSTHIFTNADGYVQVYLADAEQKNYRIRFFDEAHKFLFSIQKVKQNQFILDKTDFMRSGWFYFELSEDNRVKERNKFYIPKDF